MFWLFEVQMRDKAFNLSEYNLDPLLIIFTSPEYLGFSFAQCSLSYFFVACKLKINCLSTTVFRSPSGLAVIVYVCTCMHVSKYAYMCVYVYDAAYILISCCFESKAACSFWQHQSLFFPMYFCYTCNVSLYIFVHFVLLFSFTFKFTDSVMQMVEYPQLLCSCSGLLCPSTSLNIRNGGNRQWCRRVLPVSCWYRKRFKPYLINFCWFWTWIQIFVTHVTSSSPI